MICLRYFLDKKKSKWGSEWIRKKIVLLILVAESRNILVDMSSGCTKSVVDYSGPRKCSMCGYCKQSDKRHSYGEWWLKAFMFFILLLFVVFWFQNNLRSDMNWNIFSKNKLHARALMEMTDRVESLLHRYHTCMNLFVHYNIHIGIQMNLWKKKNSWES